MPRTSLWLASIVLAFGTHIAFAQGTFQPRQPFPSDREDSPNPAQFTPPETSPSTRSFNNEPSNDLRNTVPVQTPRAEERPESMDFNSNIPSSNGDRIGRNLEQTDPANHATLSEQLVQKFSIARAGEPLPGYPLKLADALRNGPPNRRKDLVKAYWAAYASWANFVVAADRLQKLNQIPRPDKQPELALLNASRQTATNDLALTEYELAQSQQELQLAMNSGPTELLPLPSDAPIVNGYETHFDWYSNNSPVASDISTVNQMLPKLLRLIENRSESIRVCEAAIESSRQGYSSRQVDLAVVMYACDQCQANWSQWIRSVRDYNLAITEYSLRVASPGESPERIAKMLVAPIPGSFDESTGLHASEPVYEGMIQPVRATLDAPERFAEDHRASIIERPEDTASSIFNQIPLTPVNPIQKPNDQSPADMPKGSFEPRRQSGVQFKLGG